MEFSVMNSFLLFVSFIALFGVGSYLIAWAYTKDFSLTKSYFLVANRKLNLTESSFSIAATWVWVPALFVSVQQAYMNGWIGLFWFTVPNILCLVAFAYFAVRIRDRFPTGFTLSSYMKKVYNSDRLQNVYWVTLISLTVCAFAVQLLAGGTLVTKITGLPFFWSTVLLALLPFAYSFVFGLKSSVITDFVKIIFLFMIGGVLIPYTIYNMGGIESIVMGLGGKEGKLLDFFSENSWNLFLTFGLPITIGLMSGPFGDQAFWQRAFAVKTDQIKRSFLNAAFIFGAVPIMMGIMGLAAAGWPDITIANKQLANVEIIFYGAGLIGVVAFFMMTMSVVTSIIDSKMCAVSSIAGHDIAERFNLTFLTSARVSIILLTIGAILIANIPGLTVLHLFLFYGTLRSATLLPTVLTLMDRKFKESHLFYGILSAIIIGLPIFSYGNINKLPLVSVTGSLLTLFLPIAFGLFFIKKESTAVSGLDFVPDAK